MSLDTVLAQVDNDFDNSVLRLLELLRIPSISTDPEFAESCVDAARWLENELNRIGFSASVRNTQGHPVVIGHNNGDKAKYLFYGHYDVQPVDPLDLWITPPFEPSIEDTEKGKFIRARGACDDKGQLMTFIEACRAWKTVYGKLPDNLSVLIEGEEECGSPSLESFLDENRNELTAELALICDTGLFENHTPAIVTRLRGLLAEQIKITGPNIDLHSGMYGGVAANPARILSGILACLYDQNGRVTIPDFYRDIPHIDQETLQQWKQLDFDATAFLNEIGLAIPAGEKGYSPLESIWTRPTCEINGINSGYSGEGFKTVLPSTATSKISFRLVEGQNPVAIQSNFRKFVIDMVPDDCTVEFTNYGCNKASIMPSDTAYFKNVQQALTNEWGKEAVFIGCGGSIPVATFFQDTLQMNSLLTGFCRDDDALHSPNEKYDIECYHKGIRSWARILAHST